MATLGIGFQLSASAVGMAQGINAGVVELQKLGYAAKQTARDVSTLKTLEISKAFISGFSAIASAISSTNSLLNGFVNESIAIGEATQRSAVIFENSAEAVRKFASSGSEIGLSEKAALLATARFGTLFKTIGLAADETAAYSTRLVRLAADLASFSDTSVDDALRAISSALVGEFEPIRRYGVLLNEATLKQTALQQGLRVTTGTLDPQTKLLASYSQILRQTSLQQGDFERTSGQLANQQRILSAEWGNVRAVIGSSLQPAYRALIEALRESLPSIRNAGEQLAQFVSKVDFSAAIAATVRAFESLGNAFAVIINAASPLAGSILPSIGGYLAFINRQAIAGAITGLATAFTAAARAALGYSAASGVAATATVGLGVAIRSLLASTGIGLLVVGLGLAAGAALEWAIASDSASTDSAAAIADAEAAMNRFRVETDAAGVAAFNLGEEVKKALKVPEEISINEFAQGALSEARSAIVSLAKELGGLDKVPADVLERFDGIRQYANEITDEVLNQGQALRIVDQNSQALIATVQKLTEAEKAKADAAKASAESARKAAEESRKRVAELATQGLTAAESSRVQLNRDLLDIANEQRAAEEALQNARKAGDAAAMSAAKERLRLAQAATAEAKAQDRQRQLDALGIDEKLLKPAVTLADQFKAVRKAFDAKLIDGGEARQALRNLAAEGVQIRQEIAAELSRPARQALQVNDIRSQEGFAQYMNLTMGREDPAVEQRREQLNKLEQIRRELANVGARPVDILGGA